MTEKLGREGFEEIFHPDFLKQMEGRYRLPELPRRAEDEDKVRGWFQKFFALP